jgi:uncharacterized protein DUF3175
VASKRKSKKAARPAGPKNKAKRWSAAVTRNSDALDLRAGIFKGSARQVAAALQASAERSRRRKGTPFQSAMAMLNFEINRAGTNLSATRRRTLENAKVQLRRLFGKPEKPGTATAKKRTKPKA